jgi:hypothetical protein
MHTKVAVHLRLYKQVAAFGRNQVGWCVCRAIQPETRVLLMTLRILTFTDDGFEANSLIAQELSWKKITHSNLTTASIHRLDKDLACSQET